MRVGKTNVYIRQSEEDQGGNYICCSLCLSSVKLGGQRTVGAPGSE